MGCTLTGIVWMQGKTLLVNIGDSRTYRLRDGMLRQLTSDQTLHERDMVPLPAGKALYNCIGAGCDTEAYILDITDLPCGTAGNLVGIIRGGKPRRGDDLAEI